MQENAFLSTQPSPGPYVSLCALICHHSHVPRKHAAAPSNFRGKLENPRLFTVHSALKFGFLALELQIISHFKDKRGAGESEAGVEEGRRREEG
eukprot:148532-Rhodomonas_salina.1